MSTLDHLALAGLLKEAMAAGQLPFFEVTSGSMAPLLRVGDEVGVQSVSLNQLRKGDVVVVCDRDHMWTHRYCGSKQTDEGAFFVTRGDRSLVHDRLWAADQLLGRVVVRRRDGQQLWLDYGQGHRLNRSLARLSHYDEVALNKLSSLPVSGTAALFRRLAHRLFRMMAYTLTEAFEHAI